MDIDLSILGAPPAVFEAYDQAVRQEYRWVPEKEFRTARCEILRGFLERQVIYTCPEIRDRLESQARANLSIARLAS